MNYGNVPLGFNLHKVDNKLHLSSRFRPLFGFSKKNNFTFFMALISISFTVMNKTLPNITTQSSTPEWLLVGLNTISVITFFIGFPTNFIIIYLVMRRRILRTSTNVFVCSLAVADILVLMCMIFWTTSLHAFPDSKILVQYVYPSLDMFLGIASLLNVACVSAERAVAVAYSMKYETFVTKKRTTLIICCLWIYSLLMLILALMRIPIRRNIYNKVVLYLGFICYIIPVTIVSVSYGIISFVVVNKRKKMSLLQKTVENMSLFYDTSEHKSRRRRKMLKELKISGNLLLIVIPFTTGWTFFIGTHIHEEVIRKGLKNLVHNFILIIIPWLLSGLNPVLYLILNRSLRLAFIRTWNNIFKTQSYYIDDTKTTFFTTFSRRTSNSLRRSSGNADEYIGFLPKLFIRRRDSKMSGASVQSKDSGSSKEIELCITINKNESTTFM